VSWLKAGAPAPALSGRSTPYGRRGRPLCRSDVVLEFSRDLAEFGDSGSGKVHNQSLQSNDKQGG
jgi:hypothetical protein